MVTCQFRITVEGLTNQSRVIPHLEKLREEGKIENLKLGSEAGFGKLAIFTPVLSEFGLKNDVIIQIPQDLKYVTVWCPGPETLLLALRFIILELGLEPFEIKRDWLSDKERTMISKTPIGFLFDSEKWLNNFLGMNNLLSEYHSMPSFKNLMDAEEWIVSILSRLLKTWGLQTDKKTIRQVYRRWSNHLMKTHYVGPWLEKEDYEILLKDMRRSPMKYTCCWKIFRLPR